MGHIRLGKLPNTRKWTEVKNLLDCGADSPQIAQATASAIEHIFDDAVHDKCLSETVWLLTQLPIAAKKEEFSDALRKIGLQVSNAPSVMEIIGAFSDAIDQKIRNSGGRSDLGEMAQMAAVETISNSILTRIKDIFRSTPIETQLAFYDLNTSRHYNAFIRDFFARLTNKCLNYHLSMITPLKIGENARFKTISQQGEFTNALSKHTFEASEVIEEFTGELFSLKKRKQTGISRRIAAGFAQTALQNITKMLKDGANTDAN